MAQALLFDLDGTLIDSSDDLTRALNAAYNVVLAMANDPALSTDASQFR